MKKFSLIIFILVAELGFTQVKNEKEERIKLSEFPERAQTYFNTISNEVKYLKFYKETDVNKMSYETKFKIHKLHYSVEFDINGVLEDIEIVIKEKHIPEKALNAIKAYFNSNFDHSRFIKIQKQFVGNTKKTDQQFIQHIIDHPDDKHTHFEIIAEIRLNKKRQLREFTFNRKGQFEHSRVVTSSSYEHALY
ncbi:hypothetical protein VOI54_06135 [Tamlana sp. 2201CG12-4]|uniref:hypothetical protein n=1 Tax=Tamlana sp. 2201CG12-4 TaxID=3112582 RepID=UPI002DB6DE84|nr:hypothetical protein [Tamlana sp. 2201CG12-4]MEC3906589.1 hypothetical protein [Tamlana sp. 2201CG12-4]